MLLSASDMKADIDMAYNIDLSRSIMSKHCCNACKFYVVIMQDEQRGMWDTVVYDLF